MEKLKGDVQTIGKAVWRDMLLYVAGLHEASTHAPRSPFSFPWEEIGPGYCYDRPDATYLLLERALDATNAQFARTGTVWEFYHPHGGDPQELQRKPHTSYNSPCTDYLGHNPLIAMARLYELARDCQ